MRRRRLLRRLLEALFVTEVIGQEECPLMLRWTLLAPFNGRYGKVTIHRFAPEATDADPHDHPAPFLTFILRGYYFDQSWMRVGIDKLVPKVETVRAGMVRYRRARHTHTTTTDHVGAWTLVVMGPKTRDWGFLRLADGTWWRWMPYVERFGGVIRCDDGTLDDSKPGQHAPYRLPGREPTPRERMGENSNHESLAPYKSQHPQWNGTD